MNTIKPPAGMTSSNFEEIESAVMETERGRWFLAEYARRVRAEASDVLLLALCRIEDNLKRREATAASTEGLLGRQIEMMEERLLDLVWRLREEKAERASAVVEAEVTELRRLAGRPISEALEPTVSEAERRETDATGPLSRRLLSIDQCAPRSASAGEATALSEPQARSAARPSGGPPVDVRLAAFIGVDAMTPIEKLAFFA